MFACIAYACALIRFWFPQPPDLSGRFTHPVAIDAGERDGCLLRVYDRLNAGRELELDGVRETVLQAQLVPGPRGRITEPDDFQIFFEALADADHRVVDQGPGQTV